MRDQSKDLHVSACLCANIEPKILEEKKGHWIHTHICFRGYSSWTGNYLMHVDGMETHLGWGKLWLQCIAPDTRVTVRHTGKKSQTLFFFKADNKHLDFVCYCFVINKLRIEVYKIPVNYGALTVVHGSLRVEGGGQEAVWPATTGMRELRCRQRGENAGCSRSSGAWWDESMVSPLQSRCSYNRVSQDTGQKIISLETTNVRKLQKNKGKKLMRIEITTIYFIMKPLSVIKFLVV